MFDPSPPQPLFPDITPPLKDEEFCDFMSKFGIIWLFYCEGVATPEWDLTGGWFNY